MIVETGQYRKRGRERIIVKTRESRETRGGKKDCKNWRIQRNEEGFA